MTISSRDKELLQLLLTGALVFAAWYFWLSPASTAIKTKNAEIARLNQVSQELTDRKVFIDAVSKDLNSNPDARRLLELAAPADSGSENLLASLDAMATASGVTMMSFQPQITTTNPNELNLTVSITGTFPAIQTFINSVERNERPLKINSMTLANSSNISGSTILSATLSLSTIIVGAENLKADIRESNSEKEELP